MKQIIADSGGSKTDWCIVDENGDRTYFTTRSYHPKLIDDSFISAEQRFWLNDTIADFDLCTLYFFGSGCYRSENADKMKAYLKQIGFRHVHVQSDLHAAAFAMGVSSGWCAICGTGSVAFEVHDGEVSKLHGGHGFEIGDEGSGFYFGKLVVEALRTGILDYNLIRDYVEVAFSKEQLLNPIDEISQHKMYAQLPYLLRACSDYKEIKLIHHNNIRIFLEKYLEGCRQISLAGSYAFYHQDQFREVFRDGGIEVVHFLERPIDALTDYILKATDY